VIVFGPDCAVLKLPEVMILKFVYVPVGSVCPPAGSHWEYPVPFQYSIHHDDHWVLVVIAFPPEVAANVRTGLLPFESAVPSVYGVPTDARFKLSE
jgi:hypothetical protein